MFAPYGVEKALHSENLDVDGNVGQADNAVNIFAVGEVTMPVCGIEESVAEAFAYLLGTRGKHSARNADKVERAFEVSGDMLACVKFDGVSVAVAGDVDDGVH